MPFTKCVLCSSTLHFPHSKVKYAQKHVSQKVIFAQELNNQIEQKSTKKLHNKGKG